MSREGQGEHACGSIQPDCDEHEQEDDDREQQQGPWAQVVHIGQAAGHGLSKVHNQAHGRQKGRKEELAVLVELVRCAPAQPQVGSERQGAWSGPASRLCCTVEMRR